MPLIRLDQLQQFAAVNVSRDPGAIGGPVVVPSCAQIVWSGGLESGHLWHIVTYGRYSGTFAGSVAQANSILVGLATSGTFTTLAGFLGANTNFGIVTIRDVNTANAALISSTSAGGVGTSASPSLPNEVSLVATLRTALAGRQNRGRIFFPGWATNALGAGNVVAAAAVTAYQNWVNTIMGVYSGQGYSLAIGQKARQAYTGSTGTSHPARAASSVLVTSINVRDNHWDTVRKRGLK